MELYHDLAQEGPSKSLLRLSLTYWERRIRETYAYSQTTGYVVWDQIRWWKAIPSLPNLFQDKEDTLQNHLHRLWEEEGLTAMTNYCLTLDLEAGKSPLARYEAPEYTFSRSRRMLGSMDPLLLAACVRGTVASLAKHKVTRFERSYKSLPPGKTYHPEPMPIFSLNIPEWPSPPPSSKL